MIMDAKEKGLAWFDLFGTAPEGAGPEHEWYGFTSFKKSFGGSPVSFAGTWDLPCPRVVTLPTPVCATPGKLSLRRGRKSASVASRHD